MRIDVFLLKVRDRPVGSGDENQIRRVKEVFVSTAVREKV